MGNQNVDRTVNTRNVTPAEVAYRDGYVQGKTASNDPLQSERQLNRESDSAASGFLTGAVITAVVGAGLAMYFFVYQAQRVPVKTTAPTPAPKVEKETKIIEKTTDRVLEIMPSPIAVPPAPTNVEITLPNPPSAPATQPAQAPSATEQPVQPSAQPTQPASPNP